MIKNIKVNLDLIESMLYYWKATSEKEKVGEKYIISIAEDNNMKQLFSEDFDSESVRRALSAISNREIFKPNSKKEGRFWNNNMWMLEDLEFTNMMVKPVKLLNLDSDKEKIPTSKNFEQIEVVFLPGHMDVSYMDKNLDKIFINFFRVAPSLYDESVKIDDVEFKDYILNKITELVK
ncbi:TDE2712 family protein [Helicovermis profundi]|uniref:Uncharacterized protein n=1 Tax=Helicovermis profundi TaxID=3065157 RepID=A0AAU9EL60_9FIRM|nr:hypothetical protein HLPR_03120 [Clostridia bacterium S502]